MCRALSRRRDQPYVSHGGRLDGFSVSFSGRVRLDCPTPRKARPPLIVDGLPGSCPFHFGHSHLRYTWDGSRVPRAAQPPLDSLADGHPRCRRQWRRPSHMAHTLAAYAAWRVAFEAPLSDCRGRWVGVSCACGAWARRAWNERRILQSGCQPPLTTCQPTNASSLASALQSAKREPGRANAEGGLRPLPSHSSSLAKTGRSTPSRRRSARIWAIRCSSRSISTCDSRR